MKLIITATLRNANGHVRRKYRVNDSMRLDTFCENVIISMNGLCKHLYQIILYDEIAYLSKGNRLNPFYEEEMITDQTLETEGVVEGTWMLLNYDFRSDWEFDLIVTEEQEGFYKKDFEVIEATGKGILEDQADNYWHYKLYENKITDDILENFIKKDEYFYDYNKQINLNKMNKSIESYPLKEKELYSPKNYEINVALKSFSTKIKRKFKVDNDVLIDDFCKCVIKSMKGDLHNDWKMEINKDFLEKEILKNYELKYLELKEKQKFKLYYKDSWIFEMTVSKIREGFSDSRVKITSGKGYGILEDIGGPTNLEDELKKRNIDIDDFDIFWANMIINNTIKIS